jgi:acyl carrier protein
MYSRADVEKIVVDTIKLHVSRGTRVNLESEIIKDLGLEHGYVYLYIDLERRFGFKIPDSELLRIYTVRDLINLYYAYAGKNEPKQSV